MNNKFITAIAPLIQKECEQRGYKYPSAIIGQACLESRYGDSILSKKFFNYFGMKCGSSWKGKGVKLSTMEEYTKGQYTKIQDLFRVYSSMEEGVKGYFDFIKGKRYTNLLDAEDPQDYIQKIKNDGYATSSKYVTNVMNVVNLYNLYQYDPGYVPEVKVVVPVSTVDTITDRVAREVIAGRWGNGSSRATKLKAAGYDPVVIQKRVNQIIKEGK